MKPLIATADEQRRLRSEAYGWIGTPYAADGAVKGAGVSCAMLPYEILSACGLTVPRPPKRGDLPKTSLLGAMRAWLSDQTAHFQQVEKKDVAPGDVILLDAGIGHLLLVVDRDVAIQSVGITQGVRFVSLKSPAIVKRQVGIWRPIIL